MKEEILKTVVGFLIIAIVITLFMVFGPAIFSVLLLIPVLAVSWVVGSIVFELFWKEED